MKILTVMEMMEIQHYTVVLHLNHVVMINPYVKMNTTNENDCMIVVAQMKDILVTHGKKHVQQNSPAGNSFNFREETK